MKQNTYIIDLERALNDVDSSYITFNAFIGLNKDEKIAESPFFSTMLNENYVDE